MPPVPAAASPTPTTSRSTRAPVPPVADGAELPKLDGRRTHIVDRALDYAALADQGMTASRIARKRRRSQGYVSIALRLGRAVQGMEPGELAALRSPRVTWKLAQRIVRQDADVVSIRHQLRTALGGFSTHNVDGRKHRKARRAAGGVERAVGVAWGWDAAWFARDPAGYVDAHLRYLLGVQRSVAVRAQRAVGAHGIERLSVGQGIRSLQRTLSATRSSDPTHASPAERRALDALEILARKLDEAGAEIAALPAAPTAPAASAAPAVAPAAAPAVVRPPRPARGTTAHDVPDEIDQAIEDDLRD